VNGWVASGHEWENGDGKKNAGDEENDGRGNRSEGATGSDGADRYANDKPLRRADID